MLLYAPVPLYSSDNGYLLEDQACNGLRLWAENFKHVIVMFPVQHGVAPPSWIPLRSAQVDFEHVEVVALPTAYRIDQFLRHQAAIRRQIRELIDRARYLSFSIGGLIGDWGAIAAMEAHRKKRRFAVWTDRVESEVVREQVHSGKTFKKRRMAALTHWPMAMLERALIRRATVGLFHGAETYAAYEPYANAAEIVHDIHLSEKDRIPPMELAKKKSAATQGPLRICYVGRADAMKGPTDWVQVMVELNKKGVEFQATWLGDGEALPAMRAEVTRQGMEDRVKLPGFVKDRTVLLETLRRSHILVFCHKTPESPRNLIEALVSGTPIVGYDSHFPRDLIASHGGGVLTTPNDIGALVATLEALAHDRVRLCTLIDRATLDGEPFNDVAVFKHRSEVIRAHL